MLRGLLSRTCVAGRVVRVPRYSVRAASRGTCVVQASRRAVAVHSFAAPCIVSVVSYPLVDRLQFDAAAFHSRPAVAAAAAATVARARRYIPSFVPDLVFQLDNMQTVQYRDLLDQFKALGVRVFVIPTAQRGSLYVRIVSPTNLKASTVMHKFLSDPSTPAGTVGKLLESGEDLGAAMEAFAAAIARKKEPQSRNKVLQFTSVDGHSIGGDFKDIFANLGIKVFVRRHKNKTKATLQILDTATAESALEAYNSLEEHQKVPGVQVHVLSGEAEARSVKNSDPASNRVPVQRVSFPPKCVFRVKLGAEPTVRNQLRDKFRDLGFHVFVNFDAPSVFTVRLLDQDNGNAEVAMKSFQALSREERPDVVSMHLVEGKEEERVWRKASSYPKGRMLKFVCESGEDIRKYDIHYARLIRALGSDKCFIIATPDPSVQWIKVEASAWGLVEKYYAGSHGVPGVDLEILEGEEAVKAWMNRNARFDSAAALPQRDGAKSPAIDANRSWQATLLRELKKQVANGEVPPVADWARAAVGMVKDRHWRSLHRLFDTLEGTELCQDHREVYAEACSALFVKDWVSAKAAFDVQRLYNRMVAVGIAPDDTDRLRLLKALYASGQRDQVEALFYELPEASRDQSAWAILLKTWGKVGDTEKIMKAYTSVLRASGVRFLSERVLEALTLCKAGPELKSVWKDMDRDNLFSYRALGIFLRGMSVCRDMQTVNDLADKIVDARYPSAQLMTNVLSAYTHRPLRLLQRCYQLCLNTPFPDALVTDAAREEDEMLEELEDERHYDEDALNTKLGRTADGDYKYADSVYDVAKHFVEQVDKALPRVAVYSAPVAEEEESEESEELDSDSMGVFDHPRERNQREFPVLPNRVHFHVMLRAFARAGHWNTLELVSDFMENSEHKSVKADDSTYDRLAQCYLLHSDLRHVMEFLDNMLKADIIPTYVTMSSVMTKAIAQNDGDVLLQLHRMCSGKKRQEFDRLSKDIMTYMDNKDRGRSTTLDRLEKEEEQ